MMLSLRPLMRTLLLFLLAFGLLACGTGGGTAPPPGPPPNPLPSITSLSQSSATVGGGDFTLTVNGNGFISTSVVRWNGADRPTTFVSSGQLRTTIPASDIATVGTPTVTVFNPSPGGGSSNSVDFAINNPVPGISSLTPPSLVVGGADFTLTVTGSGFISASVVQWNGVDQVTTFVSDTELQAAIPAGDIATAGTPSVTVFNPAPGGGNSNAVTFFVNNPPPALTSLSPSSIVAGQGDFTLTVNGADFVASSVVRWNGADRPTTLISSTELQAAIPAGDIATAGTPSVTVFNPAPGGGSSNAVTFFVNNPPPSVTALTPTNILAGQPDFTLTVNGADFVASSVVRWNGADRPTTLISNTELQAVISANDITFGALVDITVFTPSPGGGTAGPLTFTVNNPVPQLTTLFPANALAGEADFLLTVEGASFAPSSVVRWNGADRPTTFLNSTQLEAAITARDIALGGAAALTVFNPLPAGGESASQIFPITSRPGIIEQLSVATDDTKGIFASTSPSLSATGRFSSFTSDSDNLVSGDTNNAPDVFIRDTCLLVPGNCAPSTALVSLASDGGPADDGSATPSIGANGRFVAFGSEASNLVSGDSGLVSDVFVRDTCIGQTQSCTPSTSRSSVANDGTEADQPSSGLMSSIFLFSSISATGRFVAFATPATNLVVGDTNGVMDVFVHDTCLAAGVGCAPTTIRVSVDSNGNQGLAESGGPSISADGRYVAFQSAASLDPADTLPNVDVYVRDTCAGAPIGCTPSTTFVSPPDPSVGINHGGIEPSISADGRFVAFSSGSTQMVPNDTNGAIDIFVRDTCIGADMTCVPSTARVSLSNSNAETISNSRFASISADGRFVAFQSAAPNLIFIDINGVDDIFVRDTCVGADVSCVPSILRASTDSNGTDANSASVDASLSADGRVVGFTSSASNLVAGNTNSQDDVYLARSGFAPTNPAPSLSSLSPSSATALDPVFTLTVTGTDFVPVSVVQWNGQDRPTIYVSRTKLLVRIAASDVATAGIAQVTVVNPLPGGGTSTSLTFTIN